MKKTLAEMVLESNQQPVSEHDVQHSVAHRKMRLESIPDTGSRVRFNRLLAEAVKPPKSSGQK